MADNPSALSSSASPERALGLVVGIKGFLSWLGGSLASILAVFYATGYLVTRAHLNLLGLYGVLDFDNQSIVQEGARFFLVVWTSRSSEEALPLLTLVELAVIGVTAFHLLLRRRVRRWEERLRSRLPAFSNDGWLRLAAFSALVAAFIYHADTFLLKFQSPLCIGNLLYADSGAAQCSSWLMQGGADEVKQALFRRNEDWLDDTFRNLVAGLLLSVALAYLTWRITLPWRWRLLYAAPSYLATMLYLILLPMDYGVLQRPITYPRVVLTAQDNAAFPMTGPVFLLNRTAGEFVVWDASLRKLFWISGRHGQARRAGRHTPLVRCETLSRCRASDTTTIEERR